MAEKLLSSFPDLRDKKSPYSVSTLSFFYFLFIWSSFLDPLTDISNFNYLVLKMFSEKAFISSVVLQQIAIIQEQLLPASGVRSVKVYCPLTSEGHGLEVTEFLFQGFTVFFLFIQCFIFATSFSSLNGGRYTIVSKSLLAEVMLLSVETFSYIFMAVFFILSFFINLLSSQVKLMHACIHLRFLITEFFYQLEVTLCLNYLE